MTKYEFDENKNYRFSLVEISILVIGVIIFLILYVFLLLNIGKILNVFHKIVFGKDGDMIFSLYSGGVFMLSFTFIAMAIFEYGLYKLFLFFKFNRAALSSEIAIFRSRYKTLTYEKYLSRKKFMIGFLIVITIISSFPIFVHLRISTDGIYFTKYLSYKEKYYSYEDIESVSVYLEMSKGKNPYLMPQAVIKFGEYEENIWKWNSDAEEILRSVTLLTNNGVKLILSNKFDERILYELNNNCTQEKREQILVVFGNLGQIK